MIYADTEAVSLKHDTCRHNPDNSYTLSKETQIPCAMDFCAVDKKGGSDYYGFEGEKCIEEFLRWLRENAKSISVRKQKHRRLIITDEERKQMIDQGTRCVICQMCLNDEKVITLLVKSTELHTKAVIISFVRRLLCLFSSTN